jgi:hypothetical protein
LKARGEIEIIDQNGESESTGLVVMNNKKEGGGKMEKEWEVCVCVCVGGVMKGVDMMMQMVTKIDEGNWCDMID